MHAASATYWVLVADSGRAHILELRRKPAEFREVRHFVAANRHLPSRELESDASGRAFHVQGPSSHSKQPRSNAHDQAEQAFTTMLIRKLEQAARLNVFEHLVVVADPKTLGRLRRGMSRSLAARVTTERNLDLAGMKLESLEKRVRAELGWPERA